MGVLAQKRCECAEIQSFLHHSFNSFEKTDPQILLTREIPDQ
jgi:hypothetical protein